jgi:acyl-CoA thioesterase FadM
VRVGSLGKKHFVMEYLARNEAGEDLASGETTMVMYDYRAGKTKRISPDIRSSIEAWEKMDADADSG